MKKILLFFCVIFFLFSSVCWADRTTSGVTLGGLVTEVRSFIVEPTASFVSDLEIETWINKAVMNVVAWSRCMTGSTQFVLDTGVTEYEMLDNYVAVTGVQYQSGATKFRSLKPTNVNQRDRVAKGFDKPEFFYEDNGVVGILPLKDTDTHTATGNTIYVLYVPLQSKLETPDAIPTPADYDELIVYYATWHAFLKKQFYTSAAIFKTLYREEIDRYRQDLVYKPKKGE